ncbi:DUF4843 domain-containing protein [Parasegetibacter sp. NRK P23]|uniref:DUF4843 domain-containing protein n=1 Tax=Parasegetibacter sp. NRK P23 TaxID=2942999 RepID=UPI00204394E6|nr:DUF4843 domain-containing protein [Parasegetibacter sp. NRK P23]MCM5527596.1 DUF4843 domain-containing protein [Parasegetibacter sp. NRK P23]
MKITVCLFVTCAAAVLLGTSCKKDPLLTYAAPDNIYFEMIEGANPAQDYLGRYADSLNLSFAFSPGAVKDTLIGIPVAVTGSPAAQDRSFGISVDPASTAIVSTHYEFPASFTLRAGRLKDSVFVKLKRATDLTSKSVSIVLHLEENENFETKIKFRSRNPRESTSLNGDTIWVNTFRINLTDRLGAGPFWNDYYYSYFGDFSEKKVRLINQIAGMPLDFWSAAITTDQQSFDATYYGAFMARYLSDQAFAGNTIFESDGTTPMKMGYRFP